MSDFSSLFNNVNWGQVAGGANSAFGPTQYGAPGTVTLKQFTPINTQPAYNSLAANVNANVGAQQNADAAKLAGMGAGHSAGATRMIEDTSAQGAQTLANANAQMALGQNQQQNQFNSALNGQAMQNQANQYSEFQNQQAQRRQALGQAFGTVGNDISLFNNY